MDNKYAKLFEPIKLGRLHLKNRIAFSPVHTRFVEGVTEDGTFTKWYNEFFRARAKGGTGLIITGHIKAERDIDPYPVNMVYPCLDREERVKEFAELVETVHLYDAKIAAELSPGSGRLADIPQPGQWPAPSASETGVFMAPDLKTRPLTKDEIKELVEYFGQAANRVMRAGFDALYIHANSYLIDQFLSSCWNQRTDEYGGSLENRFRFLKECYESARKMTSPDYPMIFGFSMDHQFEGGRTLEESIEIAKLAEQLDFDAFHVRNGCYDAMDGLISNAHYPDAMVLDNLAKFRKEIKTPLITDGRFGDPDLIAQTLNENKVEVVGMARSLMTDAEWVNKVKKGKIEDIRPCTRCMECFDRVISMSKYMGCSVNPELGWEREAPVVPTHNPKKVLIVGGGPGGMEAARIAAQRGHKVTIAEKSDRLGGRLNEASVADFKYLTGDFMKWLQTQVKKQDVEIKLNTTVDKAFVEQFKPDSVIIASGAQCIKPEVEGADKAVQAIQVLEKQVDTGKSVVVVGGGIVGCETAYYLAQQGKSVTVIEQQAEVLLGESVFSKYTFMGKLAQLRIEMKTNTCLKAIKDNGITVTDAEGKEQTIEADTVVLSVGFESAECLACEIEALVDEVFVIGDARQSRRVYDAIHEAFALAKEL